MMNMYSRKYGVSQVITYHQFQGKLWHVIAAIYEYSAIFSSLTMLFYMSLYSTHEGMAVSFWNDSANILAM